jgi:alkylation response protein AidB-like acyl-CoA dehydrogenase
MTLPTIPATARTANDCCATPTLYPVERYWRDARLTKIFEGTSEIMQRIISDGILGKPSRG